jgi:hypothetical protein
MNPRLHLLHLDIEILEYLRIQMHTLHLFCVLVIVSVIVLVFMFVLLLVFMLVITLMTPQAIKNRQNRE